MAKAVLGEQDILTDAMLRDLFESECRVIRNVALDGWGAEPARPAGVHREWHDCTTDSTVQFNRDFELRLDERDIRVIDGMSWMASVVPNTLGAEVFLTVEKGTYRPLVLQLLGGAAFGIRQFTRYVRHVERLLQRLANSAFDATATETDCSDRNDAYKELVSSAARVSFENCAYARILVVGSDICFLVFPKSAIPVAHGRRNILMRSSRCEMHCFANDSDITCLDGWLSIDVLTKECKLAALGP